MIHYRCPLCANHVAIRLVPSWAGKGIREIGAWCHGVRGTHKVTRMEIVEPADLSPRSDPHFP